MTATTSRGPGEQTFADIAEGVRNTVAAYCHALDDGRTDDLVALFTGDGSAQLPGMDPATGHDALRALYGRLVPRAPQRHVVVNTAVTARDDGLADAVSDLVFLTHGGSGWSVSLVGRYADRLRLDGGRWRFASRTLSFTPTP